MAVPEERGLAYHELAYVILYQWAAVTSDEQCKPLLSTKNIKKVELHKLCAVKSQSDQNDNDRYNMITIMSKMLKSGRVGLSHHHDSSVDTCQ